MNTKKIKNKPFTFWLFLLAGIVFVLSTTKHFLFESNAETSFYAFELTAFLIFLIMLILTEKQYINYKNQIKSILETSKEEQRVLQEENLKIQKKLSSYEMVEDEAQALDIQQENILKKIFQEKTETLENHSFLYYFSEAANAMAAIIYTQTKPSEGFTVQETYGLSDNFIPAPFSIGEGLNGQVVLEGKPLVIENIPEDYLQVQTGLGNAKPTYLYFLPVMKDKNCLALIELATFKKNDLEKMWQVLSSRIIEKGVF